MYICISPASASTICVSFDRLVRRSLTTDAAHALVRAMIHSRLDYCNSCCWPTYWPNVTSTVSQGYFNN